MDEQEIRKWAFDKFAPKKEGECGDLISLIRSADALAAWVMSGKQPDAHVPQVSDS